MHIVLTLLVSIMLVLPTEATSQGQTSMLFEKTEPLSSNLNLNLNNVDLVKVDKSARKMHLIQGSKIVKSYSIALGANPKGHKLREGDKRTPEGKYTLDLINERSSFYRSIRINYPSDEDAARAELFGFSPGGQIMIHGQANGSSKNPREKVDSDWTQGCIAISNQEMDEFLRLVPIGTPIDISW